MAQTRRHADGRDTVSAMWSLEAITKASITAGAPLLTLIGFGSRRSRLRGEIRENLSLVGEIEKHELLRDHTLASAWLQGRITLDVARLSGQALGTPKAPIKIGSIVTSVVLGLVFGAWCYLIDRNGFVWYSVFPGLVAGLMTISILGQLTNRELPPSETEHLPAGAVLVRTDTASEQIATAVVLAASGSLDQQSALSGGQIELVHQFVALMQSGDATAGFDLADENWLKCRLQSWLWNNRGRFEDEHITLDELASSVLSERPDNDLWKNFLATEAAQFAEAWGSIDLAHYGFASRRRRMARNYDLVILASLGSSTNGYFVTTAAVIPNAFTFLLVRESHGWRIANHVGMAPPTPGWPPVWWHTGDPVIEALPEPA